MNWGYRLMIVFIAFAAMMIYLVYRSFQTNFELVEKTYYQSELQYQDIIDGTKLANQLSTLPKLTQSGDSLLLQMPKEQSGKNVTGTIWFYCAYNSQNDKKVALATGTRAYKNMLNNGRYTAKIHWLSEGRSYYSEQKLEVQ